LTKDDLKEAVVAAISHYGGKATIVQVAKHIWEKHESDLKGSGDRFYTWQYEMRWAANVLRNERRLLPVDDSPRGVWVLLR